MNATAAALLPILGLLFLPAVAGVARGADPAPLLAYEAVKPLAGKALPPIAYRATNYAAFGALQFGPKTSNVVYWALDTAREFAQHDILWVYLPGHPEFDPPARCRGRDMGSGRFDFRALSLTADFDGWALDLRVEPGVISDWSKREVTLKLRNDCAVAAPGARRRHRLILTGETRLSMNAELEAPLTRLFERPVVNAFWSQRYEDPQLRCRVDMGAFNAMPQGGLARTARVTLSKPDGRTVLREAMPLDTPSEAGYFSFNLPRALRTERLYQTDVEFDLSPLFGIQKIRVPTVFR